MLRDDLTCRVRQDTVVTRDRLIAQPVQHIVGYSRVAWRELLHLQSFVLLDPADLGVQPIGENAIRGDYAFWVKSAVDTQNLWRLLWLGR